MKWMNDQWMNDQWMNDQWMNDQWIHDQWIRRLGRLGWIGWMMLYEKERNDFDGTKISNALPWEDGYPGMS